MATDVTKTLRQALADLEQQRAKLDGQIAALQHALTAVAPGGRGRPKAGPGRPTGGAKRGRKAMSAAQRRQKANAYLLRGAIWLVMVALVLWLVFFNN